MPEELDFNYEDIDHVYTNSEGIVRPSVTQCLASGGMFDYSMVPPDILARKQTIGNNVHAWTADHDAGLDPSMTELSDEECSYAKAWLAFCHDTNPKFIQIEYSMMRTVCGMEIGGRPDRIAMIGRKLWVIDLKCCAAHHPGWRLQTALYEMMYTGRSCVGAMGRMAVRLKPNGKYVPNAKPYDDPSDAVAAIAFLQSATWLKNNNLRHRF